MKPLIFFTVLFLISCSSPPTSKRPRAPYVPEKRMELILDPVESDVYLRAERIREIRRKGVKTPLDPPVKFE